MSKRSAAGLAAIAAFVPTLATAQATPPPTLEALVARMESMALEIQDLRTRLAAAEGKALPTSSTATVSTAASSAAAVSPSPADVHAPPIDQARTAPSANDPPPKTAVLATLDRTYQDATPRLQVSATSGGTTVSLKVGRDVPVVDIQDGKSDGWLRRNGWFLTATAPLNKKGSTSDLATIDALPSDFELKFQRNWFQRPAFEPDEADKALGALEARAISACKEKPGTTEKEQADCAVNLQKNGNTFVRTYLGADAEKEYLQSFFPHKSGWGYGFEGKVGYKKHSFFDTSFASAEKNHVPWGVKAFGTWLPQGRITAFTASAEYQQSYEDKKTLVLCPALGAAPVQCVNGAIGAPERKDKFLTSLEFRTILFTSEKKLFNTIGLSAQFSYDHKSDDYGIDVPIYFIPDEKSNLIGGIRLGYKSDKDDFLIGLFVGAPLTWP